VADIPNALMEAWSELDRLTAKLINNPEATDLTRGEALGVARVLAMFYPNLGLKWVRAEAVRRYRHR
jgi:hypothetical protein